MTSTPARTSPLENSNRGVQIWLVAICIALIIMVSIGGITRLTGSGLSITDWKPIMGAVPPLTHADWEIAFSKYQQIPQFKLVNASITLSEFKSLFFWEWFHRLIGRLIGVIVLVPGIYFFARKQISRPLAMRIFYGFLLGGLQGAMGWFMVMSGLSERTSVSHFRLAAHLVLALSILSYFAWLTFSVVRGKQKLAADQAAAAAFLKPKFGWVVALFALQIIYGAFVAGMKAGKAFNTFPLMGGSFVPDNLLAFDPAWTNFLNNPATVQWIHRCLAWTAFFVANALWISLLARKTPRGEVRRVTAGLAHMTILQFIIGVTTLLFAVPVGLGVIHQAGAAVLVVLLTAMAHTLSRTESQPIG